MQSTRLTDSLGLPPGIVASFIPEFAPTTATLPLWVVRDRASGARRWLQYEGSDPAQAGHLAATFRVLETEHPHLLRLVAAQLEGTEPYLLYHWEGETPLALPLSSPGRERAALQLLETIHALQSLAEPVALPELALSQVWALPRTGFVRIAGLTGAVPNAGVEARRAGRSACAEALAELLGGAQGRTGLGETDQDLLAAWENDGAEAYPALLNAVQRMHLVGLVADF